MDITIPPGKLSGAVTVPPSKSMAHRMLICAVFADKPTDLICPESSDDMDATAGCLQNLGANMHKTDFGYRISPIQRIPECADLHCRESGSTLRFLLPIVGALGVTATFHLEGRLPQRPLSPLWEEMERMGCALSRPTENTIRCTGKLRSGHYTMAGNVSSQFISGLLMALPLIDGETSLEITGNIESQPYIAMTKSVLKQFATAKTARMEVEGDWSSAAFWLSANALGSSVAVCGLYENSLQGDSAVNRLLSRFTEKPTISARDIPDLVPVLSAVAAAKQGAVFTDIARLRLKESDRVAAIITMITALGGKAEATENTLTVYPATLTGGIVDSFDDHRIAMSAAIAATVCSHPVTILGAECVKKSYPKFWEEYHRLSFGR